MSCNPSKCKEPSFVKKGRVDVFEPIASIPQCKELQLLGVNFQSNCRFDKHVKLKLIKANKSLYVVRTFRKEGYSQTEIDHLFYAPVMSNISYGLSVYEAAEAELTTVQCFLDRCYERRYISHSINIHELLEMQDKTIYHKIASLDSHLLFSMIPHAKTTSYNLRNRCSLKPKVNTQRFMNSFINRLIFRYNLVT